MNVTQKLNFEFERVENIVGKGENAGFQHFLLFPQCFQKASSLGLLKTGLCGKELSFWNPCRKLGIFVFICV